MYDVERLLAVVPPPAGVVPYAVWSEVENRLGFRLPTDYKWLVDAYGSGSFGGFLAVLVPDTRFTAVRLEPQLARAEELLSSLRRTSVPVPFADGELLLAAKTDNVDSVYWVKRPTDDPDAWTLAVLGRNSKWVEFAGGIVAFLAAVFMRQVRVPFFPRFSKGARFESAPESPGGREVR